MRLDSLADAPEAFGSAHADWVDAHEDRWRARMTDVPLTVVAVDVDAPESPVGVVCGADVALAVELVSLWVSPRHRGTGLADRLIAEVTDWATARGGATRLTVHANNDRAIRSYERAGFAVTDERSTEDELVMVRPLPGP